LENKGEIPPALTIFIPGRNLRLPHNQVFTENLFPIINPTALKDFLPILKQKYPHIQDIDIDLLSAIKPPKEPGVNLHINLLDNRAVAVAVFGNDDKCTLFMAGDVQKQWDDDATESSTSQWVEDEKNSGLIEDEEFRSVPDMQIENEFYVPPLRIEFNDGLIHFRMVWKTAFLQIKDNPITLFYEHNPDYGRMYQTGCNHFWLDHIDKGTAKQAKDTLSYLQLFKKILDFNQVQKGGRRKGSRPKPTILEYNKICNLRFSREYRNRSDEEFLSDYPEYNLSKLSRAKKWRKQGKLGLKI
jgi:hypothetical protein